LYGIALYPLDSALRRNDEMVVITQLDWVIQTCFVFVMSNPPGAERHIASFEIYILSFPCYFATCPPACAGFRLPLFLTLHYSHIQLIVPFEFKKLFVLCGNDVIKTILRNVDIGNVIFPPVQKMGQDHSVDGLMADDHNIICAPV
jgi:hypothetical protein